MSGKPSVEAKGSSRKKAVEEDETRTRFVEQRHEVYGVINKVSALMLGTMFDLAGPFYMWLAERAGDPRFIHLTKHLMDKLGFDTAMELSDALNREPEDVPTDVLEAVIEFYLTMDWELSGARHDYAGSNLHPYILGLILSEIGAKIGHPGWHC